MVIKKFFSLILLLFLITIPIISEDNSSDEAELLNMSLEDLLNMQVTTASKKAQKIEEAPAAIFVITAEDIKAYGFNNVGEALRIVPGIEIFQGGDQNYEVTARGMSVTQYNTSNKVLWLINGRSVYNDVIGGVRLEAINITMDDINRIEVIRGPGSPLYGANAFQGIVNIITKTPKEKQGFSLAADYGKYNETNFNLRYANKLSEKLYYKFNLGFDYLEQDSERVYDATQLDKGYLVGDKAANNIKKFSFDANYALSENKSLNFAGGFSKSLADHYFVLPGEYVSKDFFIQTEYRDEANFFRFFYNGATQGEYQQRRYLKSGVCPDTSEYNYLVSHNKNYYTAADKITAINNQFDFEYQRTKNNISWISENFSIVYGASYRRNNVKSSVFSLDGKENSEAENLFAIYAQAEYLLFNRLNMIFGGRFDWHSTVGNYFNPRFAAIYKIDENQVLRFGANMATRNPHFLDLYVNTYLKGPNMKTRLLPYAALGANINPIKNLGFESDYILINALGSKEIKAEKLKSLELGYQVNLFQKVQLRADLFYNIMTDPIVIQRAVPKEMITVIDNIYQINPGFAANLTPLGMENIPNQMTKSQMLAKINELNEKIQQLTGVPGYETVVAQLTQLKAGLTNLVPLYNYPKSLVLNFKNSDDEFKYYGGEFTFNYFPMKNLSITMNYSYVKYNDEYNSEVVYDTLATTNYKKVKVTKSPEHKFNVGVKYNIKGFYTGVMLNYMSEYSVMLDNNADGVYNYYDMKPIYSEYIHKVDPRVNLNVNLGYNWKYLDVFVTGFNLLQDNKLQLYPVNPTVNKGDELHTRFVAGIRLNF